MIFSTLLSKLITNDCLKGVLNMRGNLVLGMIAGGLIGAAAAMIAAPYIQPQIQKVVSKGKQAINTHMNKMESGS